MLSISERQWCAVVAVSLCRAGGGGVCMATIEVQLGREQELHPAPGSKDFSSLLRCDRRCVQHKEDCSCVLVLGETEGLGGPLWQPNAGFFSFFVFDLSILSQLQCKDFDFCPGGNQLPLCYCYFVSNHLRLLKMYLFHLFANLPCCLFFQSLRAATVKEPEEFVYCQVLGVLLY